MTSWGVRSLVGAVVAAACAVGCAGSVRAAPTERAGGAAERASATGAPVMASSGPVTCVVGGPSVCASGTVCVNMRRDHAECMTVPAEAPIEDLAVPVDAATEVFLTHCPGEGSHSWANAFWALDLDSAYDGAPATIRASAPGVAYVFPQGETCPAPAGTPARTQEQPCGEGWGNHVKVFHGGGYFTLYAHLARVDVRDGQQVQRGEPLGVEGATGMAGHRHVHWSVQRLPGAGPNEWDARRSWIGESVPFRFAAVRNGRSERVEVRGLRCPHSTAGALPAEVQPRYRGAGAAAAR